MLISNSARPAISVQSFVMSGAHGTPPCFSEYNERFVAQFASDRIIIWHVNVRVVRIRAHEGHNSRLDRSGKGDRRTGAGNSGLVDVTTIELILLCRKPRLMFEDHNLHPILRPSGMTFLRVCQAGSTAIRVDAFDYVQPTRPQRFPRSC